MTRFRLVPEIRAGEVLGAAGVIVACVVAWVNVQSDLRVVKEAQAAQATTNREIRQEIREVSVDMKQEFRELRREMRPRQAGQM